MNLKENKAGNMAKYRWNKEKGNYEIKISKIKEKISNY